MRRRGGAGGLGTAMGWDYDDDNVFARILRGDLPSDRVMETERTLAFRDVRPQAPEHVLVVPKGAYVSYDHFAAEADDAEVVDFTRVVGRLCRELGLSPAEGGGGYRLISNAGPDAVQEVAHMHVHLVGGRNLGRILQPAE